MAAFEVFTEGISALKHRELAQLLCISMTFFVGHALTCRAPIDCYGPEARGAGGRSGHDSLCLWASLNTAARFCWRQFGWRWLEVAMLRTTAYDFNTSYR